MDILRITDIRRLIEAQGRWHISFYMPTHRAGREQQQDPIRLRNLIKQAEETLLAHGLRQPEVQEMLRPVDELRLNMGFWESRGDGLAIFVSEDFFAAYRLPLAFEEMVVATDSFHIKPLLALINPNGRFYILSLSLNEIRLYLATRDTIHEVGLNGIPTNMQEALQLDVSGGKYQGVHTGTDSPGRGGERPGMFYGRTLQDEEKKYILRFFQQFDQGLSTVMEEERLPMVVAGVDYLLPIFREASTYKNVLEQGVTGNPQKQNIKELHQQAWEFVEPIFAINEQEARDRFLELNGQKSPLAATDLKTVLQAAHFGRVAALFVATGVQRWGQYVPETDTLLLEDVHKPGNEDLLDRAAMETIMNSGEVYALEADGMPEGKEIAAILRYAP